MQSLAVMVPAACCLNVQQHQVHASTSNTQHVVPMTCALALCQTEVMHTPQAVKVKRHLAKPCCAAQLISQCLPGVLRGMLPGQTGLHGWAAVLPVGSERELTVILPRTSQLPPPEVNQTMLRFAQTSLALCMMQVSRATGEMYCKLRQLRRTFLLSTQVVFSCDIVESKVAIAHRTLSKLPCYIT